jgi:hypothetical protein
MWVFIEVKQIKIGTFINEELNSINTIKSIEACERTHAYHQILSSFRNIRKHLPNLMKGNQYNDAISEFVDILQTDDFKKTMDRFRLLEAAKQKDKIIPTSEKCNENLLSLERAVNEKRKKSYGIF